MTPVEDKPLWVIFMVAVSVAMLATYVMAHFIIKYW